MRIYSPHGSCDSSRLDDDAEEFREGGVVYLDSSDLELVDDGSFGGIQSAVGLRFRNVPLEPDTLIASAYITFTADEADSISTNLQIFAEATDSSMIFMRDT